MPAPHRRPLLLELDLTEPLADPDPDDRLAQWQARGRRRLRPTLRALYEAGEDRRVAGLLVKLGGRIGWARMQELRLGLARFAASGKPTVGWAESFGEDAGGMAAYVLATGCAEIWLQPGGGVGLLGVGVEASFVKDALDRVGLHAEVERRHEYKNAPDPLLRTGFSEPHREATEAVAGSVFDDALDLVAAARGLAPGRVRELVDGGPWTAPEALAAGLVDRLGYRDQVHAGLRARVAADAQLLFADRWRPPRRYLAAGLGRLRPGRPGRPRGHVALVEVRGTITPGRSRRAGFGRVAGSDTVAAQLRAAAADDRARAVLLRVDSPGGSAVASEVIWREVIRLRGAGRPVVVSMGAVAASGGYYVSCPADLIVALPATLTGSIGVFGGKLVAEDLLRRVGVATGVVRRGAHALMWSPRRDFQPAERARLAAAVDAVYADFTAKVAAGRGRTVEEVEVVARGRVWTGRDALAAGLVDELGGLREAAALARRRAGLPEDAPVRPALRLSPLARLTRPRNSDDPRAFISAAGPRPSGSGLAGSGLAGLDLAGLGLAGLDLAGLDLAGLAAAVEGRSADRLLLAPTLRLT